MLHRVSTSIRLMLSRMAPSKKDKSVCSKINIGLGPVCMVLSRYFLGAGHIMSCCVKVWNEGCLIGFFSNCAHWPNCIFMVK